MITTKEVSLDSITKIDLGTPTTFTALKATKLDLASIEKDQEDYKAAKKKYCQVKETDGKSVTEYVCPDGSAGYQIILRKTVDKKEYTKSIGYGPEAKSRTYDWTEVSDLAEDIKIISK